MRRLALSSTRRSAIGSILRGDWIYEKYALDTNTISYILKEDPVVTARIKAENDSGNALVIPLMAYYEIKRGLLSVEAKKKILYFERLCASLGVDDMRFNVVLIFTQ